MLDPKLIRSDLQSVAERLKKRGITLDVARLDALEEQRKALQVKTQDLQNERNVRSKSIGQAKAAGKNVEDLLKEVNDLGDSLKATEEQFNKIQAELNEYLAKLPNLPHESVPAGKSEEDNQVIRTWGEPKQFSFTPKDHVDLGMKLNGMNFEDGVKLSKARFVVLRGDIAKLHRALAQFMLNLHIDEHGRLKFNTPYSIVTCFSFSSCSSSISGRGSQHEVFRH